MLAHKKDADSSGPVRVRGREIHTIFNDRQKFKFPNTLQSLQKWAYNCKLVSLSKEGYIKSSESSDTSFPVQVYIHMAEDVPASPGGDLILGRCTSSFTV